MLLPNDLIVSCQALEDEPLHSSFIMGKMALAAKQGGAKGIRANSKDDILAIKQEVDLPIIGIVKRDYSNSRVYITATTKEIDELIESGCEVIAMDATASARPEKPLSELVNYVREQAPNVELMADIATIQEAVKAEELGFDYIGTTLHGYTEDTKGEKLFENDFQFLKDVVKTVNAPVIAEGNIQTPDMLARAFELGVHAVVVGGAITRPKQITERFASQIK
ncbi:N-acetylmannosamine-6-phosphate 2-epimerase [Virgibacillus sp. MSJ-26]|uniref:N-acetylmannosamine-6-phosphate 2-epimerase n=1 Tax=Virgibacillus sp. MSJ-26 TaxID=2841522 RepID=UPI001C10B9CC|nr:N-acetylmannosamine-6-phosphate 2-epimerase [Virgibacillus sp. MSJ-26]MBU5468323.1 N-acetylmannosamine-6-phosphate 2-epimerase [Virgibacillus sp. MSJ-26]